MAPIGSRHAGTITDLNARLQRALAGMALVSVQGPVILSARSEPEPVLAVLKRRADCYRSGHPEPADVFLLIEVAEISLAYDREVKLPLYAAHGILETWIVDLEGRRLGIHRQPAAAGYREQLGCPDLARVPLPSSLGGTLDLRGLFGD